MATKSPSKRKAVRKVPKQKPIRFFAISPLKLFVLSFFTVGLYTIYWFYRNWKAVHEDTGEPLSPFWRAIFSTFTAFFLFRKVARAVAGKPHAKAYRHGLMATLFIFTDLIVSVLFRVLEYGTFDSQSRLILSGVIVLAFVGNSLAVVATQQTVNRYLADIDGAGNSKTGAGSRVLMIFGFVYFVLVMLGLFAPNGTYGNKFYNRDAISSVTPASGTPREGVEKTPITEGRYAGWTKYHNNEFDFSINTPPAVKIRDYAAPGTSDPTTARFYMDLYNDTSGRTIEYLHLAVYQADLQTSARMQDGLRSDIYQVAPEKQDVTLASHKAILYYYKSDISAALYLVDDGPRTFAISGFVQTKDPDSMANYWDSFDNTVASFAID